MSSYTYNTEANEQDAIEAARQGIELTSYGQFDLEFIAGKDAWGHPEYIVTTDIGGDEPWPVTVFEAEELDKIEGFVNELSNYDTDEAVEDFIRDQIDARQREQADKFRPVSARSVRA